MAWIRCMGGTPNVSFESVSGNVCTFESGFSGLPLKAHEVAIVASQSGSGTPSPTNPRPITGYSAINISHSDADTSNPTVYTIQIGSTVYNGTYDAITGILTVTHKDVDLGSLSWSRQTGLRPNEYLFRAQITDIKTPIDTSKMLCEILTCVGTDRNALYDVDYGLAPWNNTNNYVTIRISTITDVSHLLSVINGYKLMYELVTPTTIQLSPAQILTLLGENNIFADTGDTTLQYIKLG